MRRASNPVSAIQTAYAGHLFRSRLEARWAVFFDDLGMRWEYEPQGYYVGPRRQLYLPDFFLPELGLWYEIKPAGLDDEDRGVALWNQFAGDIATCDEAKLERYRGSRAALAIGPVPDPAQVDREGPPRADRWFEPGIVILGDWHYAWCACPTGKHFDLQPYAAGGRILCGCERILDDRYRTGNYPTLLAAYAVARSARFEHGETPTPSPRGKAA